MGPFSRQQSGSSSRVNISAPLEAREDGGASTGVAPPASYSTANRRLSSHESKSKSKVRSRSRSRSRHSPSPGRAGSASDPAIARAEDRSGDGVPPAGAFAIAAERVVFPTGARGLLSGWRKDKSKPVKKDKNSDTEASPVRSPAYTTFSTMSEAQRAERNGQLQQTHLPIAAQWASTAAGGATDAQPHYLTTTAKAGDASSSSSPRLGSDNTPPATPPLGSNTHQRSQMRHPKPMRAGAGAVTTGEQGTINDTLGVPRYDSRGYPLKRERMGASPVSSSGLSSPRQTDTSAALGATSLAAAASAYNNSATSSPSLGFAYDPDPDDLDARYLTQRLTRLSDSPAQSSKDPRFSENSGSLGDGEEYTYPPEQQHPHLSESTRTSMSASPDIDMSQQTHGSMNRPFANADSLRDLYPGGPVKSNPYDGMPGSQYNASHDSKYTATSDTYSGDGGFGGPRRVLLVSWLGEPEAWAAGPEDDDDMHNPDVHVKQMGWFRSLFTLRGATNLGCMILLVTVLVVLFAGYPIITHFTGSRLSTFGAYNLGGINATGQLPDVGVFSLIDRDTPESARTHKSLETGEEWELVWSDEFKRPGRTFYDGDDPYWQAEDMHYWSTNNLEWYDPQMITTRDGHLVIQLNNHTSHGRNFTGGLMSTWNRFCFTGGYIETNVSLPGNSHVYGLWPAIWTMGNLGRMGYGGTLDGMWPYSYDTCDVGTLRNQTLDGKPKLLPEMGDWAYNDALSYLPGQRLSACTCPGEDEVHPGPFHNGRFTGRAAPEIDIFEAQVDVFPLDDKDVDPRVGLVSLSAQWAPFNPYYRWVNNSETYTIFDRTKTAFNHYQGSAWQQATSALSKTNPNCYTNATGCFSVYGYEYATGADGYIAWVSDGKPAWTLRAGAMQPNSIAQVGQRIIPEEPMYIVANLGLSYNFGDIDLDGLLKLWPVEMHVDYIRVYQDPKKRNIGCDPEDYPTAKYIEYLGEPYWNPNLTTQEDVLKHVDGIRFPKNNLTSTC